MIIRTLSKAFALAAIRVGFIVAAEEVLEQINKLILSPMPDDSARIGINALSDPGGSTCGPAKQVINLRERAREELIPLDAVEQFMTARQISCWCAQKGT